MRTIKIFFEKGRIFAQSVSLQTCQNNNNRREIGVNDHDFDMKTPSQKFTSIL